MPRFASGPTLRFHAFQPKMNRFLHLVGGKMLGQPVPVPVLDERSVRSGAGPNAGPHVGARGSHSPHALGGADAVGRHGGRQWQGMGTGACAREGDRAR